MYTFFSCVSHFICTAWFLKKSLKKQEDWNPFLQQGKYSHSKTGSKKMFGVRHRCQKKVSLRTDWVPTFAVATFTFFIFISVKLNKSKCVQLCQVAPCRAWVIMSFRAKIKKHIYSSKRPNVCLINLEFIVVPHLPLESCICLLLMSNVCTIWYLTEGTLFPPSD